MAGRDWAGAVRGLLTRPGPLYLYICELGGKLSLCSYRAPLLHLSASSSLLLLFSLCFPFLGPSARPSKLLLRRGSATTAA